MLAAPLDICNDALKDPVHASGMCRDVQSLMDSDDVHRRAHMNTPPWSSDVKHDHNPNDGTVVPDDYNH